MGCNYITLAWNYCLLDASQVFSKLWYSKEMPSCPMSSPLLPSPPYQAHGREAKQLLWKVVKMGNSLFHLHPSSKKGRLGLNSSSVAHSLVTLEKVLLFESQFYHLLKMREERWGEWKYRMGEGEEERRRKGGKVGRKEGGKWSGDGKEGGGRVTWVVSKGSFQTWDSMSGKFPDPSVLIC